MIVLLEENGTKKIVKSTDSVSDVDKESMGARCESGLQLKFMPRSSRPVPTTCGMESERGGRTSDGICVQRVTDPPDKISIHRWRDVVA